MFQVWQPCDDPVPPPEPDIALLGIFDYTDITQQMYTSLIVLALISLCCRNRVKRFLKAQRHARRKKVTFEQEVKRHLNLMKVKAVFDDMEQRHKAETGEYDSDDSAYYRFKVLGIRESKKDKDKSAREERALQKAMKNLRRKRRKRRVKWGEYLEVKYKLWRGRVLFLVRVGFMVKNGLVSVCRRRSKNDSDSESDKDGDSDSDEDAKKNANDDEISSSSDDGDGEEGDAVAGDTSEFQEMFHLTGQSEWEERIMSLIDIDGNGNIDFREFTVGMGILGTAPDPYLVRFDPPNTRKVKTMEDPDFETHGQLLKFCAQSPRFQDFVFQMLDVGGCGFVLKSEIISVVDRFARYVEGVVLKELRHDLKVERRRRRNVLSVAAREAVERVLLEQENLKLAVDDDSDSSSDESFASSYNSYDSSYGSYSSSDSGYTNSTNMNTGTDGGGSTAASSEIQEQHENVLAEKKERFINQQVQQTLQAAIDEEKEARFFSKEYQTYKPPLDVDGLNTYRNRSASDELDDLMRWHAEETAKKLQIEKDNKGVGYISEEEHVPSAAEVRLAAIERRRVKIANVRALVAKAAKTLRNDFPDTLDPTTFRRFTVLVPEPFAPAFELFRTFEHFLQPAAYVLKSVPALALDAKRARLSAQQWRKEQNPEWFFSVPESERMLGGDDNNKKKDMKQLIKKQIADDVNVELGLGNKRREKPRDDRDPDVLTELAGLGLASNKERLKKVVAVTRMQRDSFNFTGGSNAYRGQAKGVLRDFADKRRTGSSKLGGRDDKPAAADVEDASASVSVRLDGAERLRSRRRLGPRALGRGHTVQLSVQMRIRDLAHLARSVPGDAAFALSEVSLRARRVALRMLAPRDAALVLNAMDSDTRELAMKGLDPETMRIAEEAMQSVLPVEVSAPDKRVALGDVDVNVSNDNVETYQPYSNASPSKFTSFAAQDSARTAHQHLDEKTYVYMGDVEGGGGWEQETNGPAQGSDEFV